MQGAGVTAPPRVAEGGVIDIEVHSGATELWVMPIGSRAVRIPVRRGRAEYQVPPSLPGGTVIFISDMKLPKSSSATVEVVGNR